MKGPLRVTDMIVWHAGVGMGLYGVSALRQNVDHHHRMPKFFKKDDLNIPDVQQRLHWDAEWAKRAGNPASYDYGRMREVWLIHLCTDWMGDDAWLWKLDCQFRKFNYVGDTHWMKRHGHPQVPRRGRPPRRRPRDRGRQPARRRHHPRPRHDPAAVPRARSGAPARGPRWRHHLPGDPRRPRPALRRARRRLTRRTTPCRPDPPSRSRSAPSRDIVDHARTAAELGYERVFVFDSPALYGDIWVALARIAEAVPDIGLATGVAVTSCATRSSRRRPSPPSRTSPPVASGPTSAPASPPATPWASGA